MSLLCLCLLIAGAAPDAPQKPAPKFQPGRDTTFVDGPLDKDGYINYEAALNARLKGKTTPETNALVLLLKCLGPKPEGAELNPDFYKALGIDVAAVDGTTTAVSVNILGTNDAAVLSSATVALTETNAVLTATGTLTVTDVDNTAAFTPATAVGSYGSLSINAAGADLMTKLQNAVMESYDAHTSMSTQALNSPIVLRGMLDILLNHSQLYEALRARPAP